MLRVFSSIRKNLLAENKLVRYLAYAVGEVLLIMVGIILALQFQIWNEGRKLEQDRQELIENLKVDFNANLEHLKEVLALSKKNRDDFLQFLKVAPGKNDHLSFEELKLLAGSLEEIIRFQPALGAYQTALSTGTIGLLGDSALTEHFLEFQQANTLFARWMELAGDAAVLGSTYKIREQLGSMVFLRKELQGMHIPTEYALSDREFIARKEVYSAFENTFLIHDGKYSTLQTLKETTQQILATLEALD